MGLYESDDGYYMTSIYDFPPSIMLTLKGKKALIAVKKIQKWWRKIKRNYEADNEIFSDDYIFDKVNKNTKINKQNEVGIWLISCTLFLGLLSIYGYLFYKE